MPRHPRARPRRSAIPLLSALTILCLVLTIDAVRPAPSDDATRLAGDVAAAAKESPARLVSAQARLPRIPSPWTPPARALLWTDPVHDPHRLALDLARDIDAVPAGGTIKVETFYLDSSLTTPALRAAYERGVHVQIIVSGWHRGAHPDEARLADWLGTDRSRPSWLHWSVGSSRGPVTSTVDHDKVWRFSQVGDRRWVSVVGSYNNADSADDRAYALAISVADKQIYDRFDQLWAQSEADRPVQPTTRTIDGPGWQAYWLPGERLTPGADPAIWRLRSIPARPSTVMHLQMYSMFGVRGTYIAEQLIRMAHRGARITLIAGPTVAWSLQRRMRRAGIDVQGGCWPDGTFDHAKDMSASWLRGGRRVYWTWTGSDNWNDANYLHADQVELGLAGHDLYMRFSRIFAAIARRPDVPPWRCTAR